MTSNMMKKQLVIDLAYNVEKIKSVISRLEEIKSIETDSGYNVVCGYNDALEEFMRAVKKA